MTVINIIKLSFPLLLIIAACNSTEKYKQDLLSDDQNKIDRACYELGEVKDTSAIRQLFTRILDPRRSTNLRFKGMTVNYCRLGALKKISGVEPANKLDRFNVDTATTLFYLNWAIQKGYLKEKSDVDIYYYK